MNVALSILLVVTFLLPGLIFRRFYYSEEFSKESFKESFFQVLYTAFFPSIFLYFFTIWWVGFLNYSIDFNLIGTLVAPDESNKTVFNNINQMQSEIVWFHIGLYFEAAFFGFLFRTIVRKRGWDKSVKLFRYQNHWHYLFTGEYIDFRRSTSYLEEHTTEEIEITFLDIVVETKEGSILYEGVLDDYEVDKNGDLVYVILNEVDRRYLKHDQPGFWNFLLGKSTHYEIPGHSLMIPNQQIKNINFTYFGLDFNADREEVELFEVK